MTDAEANTLLQNLITETQNEENNLTQTYTDFDNAKSDVQSALNGVSNKLTNLSKHINYAIDFFNI